MAVKEIAEKRASLIYLNQGHFWNSQMLWHGASALRLPQEAAVHRVLNTEPSAAVVGYRSDVVYQQRKAFRIYLDFCPYKDLWCFSDRYKFVDEIKNEEQRVEIQKKRQEHLPEPFLWYLMLRLTEACITLKSVPERSLQSEAIHRDIKLENIYMDEPGDEWPDYPTPRLGDFGLTIFTNERDNRNPENYAGYGTDGWKAPEQFHEFCDELAGKVEIPIKIDARTNIWAIGLTIWAVALGYGYPPSITRKLLRTMARSRDSAAYRNHFPYKHWGYSQGLRDQVEECMSFDRARRPWPEDLRRQLRYHMNGANLFPSQWPDHLRAKYRDVGPLRSRWRIGERAPGYRFVNLDQWVNEDTTSFPVQGAAEQAAEEPTLPPNQGQKRKRGAGQQPANEQEKGHTPGTRSSESNRKRLRKVTAHLRSDDARAARENPAAAGAARQSWRDSHPELYRLTPPDQYQ